ncbi:hypothetical protein [Rhodoferax sp.]|uniref:hypothetical protein n=1 Tax=Rhodoferax sp. TaxID=50421 RepID=UPI00374DC18D
MQHRRFSIFYILLTAGSALLGASTAGAADAPAPAEAQARYQREMATCADGRSNQDAATCRIEAERALAEARRGGLSAAPGQYQQNALQRCDAFQGADRMDCEARMREPNGVSGSAQSGGILRETTTIIPIPAPPP